MQMGTISWMAERGLLMQIGRLDGLQIYVQKYLCSENEQGRGNTKAAAPARETHQDEALQPLHPFIRLGKRFALGSVCPFWRGRLIDLDSACRIDPGGGLRPNAGWKMKEIVAAAHDQRPI